MCSLSTSVSCVPGWATGWPAASTAFWALGITWNVSNGKESQEELQKHFVLLDLTAAINDFSAYPQVGHSKAGYPPSVCSFVHDEQAHLLAGVWCQGSWEVSPAHWHSSVPQPYWTGPGAAASVVQIAHEGAHFSLISGPVPLWRRSILSLFQIGQFLVAAALGLFGLPQIICLLMKCDPLIEAAVSFLTFSPVTYGCSADSSPYIIWDNCFHV